MLDTSEEDAIKQFEALLNDTSYLTVVFDRIHDWAQYLRECESPTLIKTRPS
jgi:phosphatidylinositol 3-kinase